MVLVMALFFSLCDFHTCAELCSATAMSALSWPLCPQRFIGPSNAGTTVIDFLFVTLE